MKNALEKLRLLQERIARSPFPAMALGEDGQILYRNRAAARLFPRRRSLASLLGDGKNEDSALILHRAGTERFLIWMTRAKDCPCREVRFLMDLPETETALFRGLLHSTGLALEAGGTVTAAGETLRQAGAIAESLQEDPGDGEEPLELTAFLRKLQPVFARAGLELSLSLPSEKLWIPPLGGDLILALGQALRLLNGPSPMELSAESARGQLFLTLAFSDGRGVSAALEELFSRQATPDLTRAAGLLPFFTVVRRCGEAGFDLRFEEAESRGRIALCLPASANLPDYFMGGRRRRSKFGKKDFLKW